MHYYDTFTKSNKMQSRRLVAWWAVEPILVPHFPKWLIETKYAHQWLHAQKHQSKYLPSTQYCAFTKRSIMQSRTPVAWAMEPVICTSFSKVFDRNQICTPVVTCTKTTEQVPTFNAILCLHKKEHNAVTYTCCLGYGTHTLYIIFQSV